MGRINSLDELRKLKEVSENDIRLRTTGENPDRTVLAVGMGTCGISAGAKATLNALIEKVFEKKLNDVSVIATGCMGYCNSEPLVEVRMPGKDVVRYGKVDEKRAVEIVEKHICDGVVIEDAVIGKEVR